MASFQEHMIDYKKQLQKGSIQKAYQGLMAYIRDLRSYLENKYPDHHVPGNIYYGYMDMTYFSFFPGSLKERNLKTGIVFQHEDFRFEVWLFGVNKNIQATYWQLIKDSGWDNYDLSPTPKSFDYIIRHVLIEDPDFSDLDALTDQIESGTLDFIKDVEDFLAKQ